MEITSARILFVDHSARLSGAEIAMVVLAEDADKFEPVVLLGEAGPLEPRLTEAQIRFHVVDVGTDLRGVGARKNGVSDVIRAGVGAARFALAIRRVMLAENPDIVIANTAKTQFIVGLMAPYVRRNARLVFYMRDQLTRSFFSAAPLLALQSLYALSADAIIANSMSTLGTVNRVARRKPALVLASPITVPPRPDSQTRLEGFHFGMVARLSPWKGQLEAIAAFGAAQFDEDTHLWIVGGALFGESDYEQELRNLVRELRLETSVHFTGHVSNVYELMSGWDALVHFSTKPEPFGQVVLQGMACGLPIIASDAGGPSELLKDEESGLLVPLGDVSRLTVAMRRLNTDSQLRGRLGRAALIESEAYRPEEIKSRFSDFCLSLITRDPRDLW